MKYIIKLFRLSMVFYMISFKPCIAQSVNFNAGGLPVEIIADNGIEWHQEKLVFIARGNAKAIRGKITVFAKELRAYYKKSPEGSTEIWRVDAINNVRFETDGNIAYGQHAVYDVNSKVLTLIGNNLKLIAKNDTLTAKDQMEYWEEKQMAVARGNAIAIRTDKKLYADILAAYFRKSKNSGTEIYRVDAFDNVKIITEKDKAESNRGVYNVKSGIVSLTGAVKIIRDQNVLRGCSADVNLNTGISRLHRCPKGEKRVSGVINSKNK